MNKRTNLAVAAAILLIAMLIGFGILLASEYKKGNLSDETSYQLAQEKAAYLLAEFDAITTSGANAASEADTASEANAGSEMDTASGNSNAETDAGSVSASDAEADNHFISGLAAGGNTITGSSTENSAAHQEDGESETEPDTEWVLELLAMEDTPVIWVGDSRTVGMQKALGSYTEDIFIGAAGEGYTWLYETGVARLKMAISEYPGWPVIMNMGVNDYENLYNYMDLYEELAANYPDTVFWYLSVNPVDDNAGLYITNAQIEEFNASLAAAYPDTWLDSYTFLAESDAGTIDGIHYSEEVYRMIYQFVKEALRFS